MTTRRPSSGAPKGGRGTGRSSSTGGRSTGRGATGGAVGRDAAGPRGGAGRGRGEMVEFRRVAVPDLLPRRFRQDAVLQDLESGRIALPSVPSKVFFDLLLKQSLIVCTNGQSPATILHVAKSQT